MACYTSPPEQGGFFYAKIFMYNLYDVIMQPNEALPSIMNPGAGLPAGAPPLLDFDY